MFPAVKENELGRPIFRAAFCVLIFVFTVSLRQSGRFPLGESLRSPGFSYPDEGLRGRVR